MSQEASDTYFLKLNQSYTQRVPEKNVKFITIFAVSRLDDLAFGRRTFANGNTEPGHVVYSRAGSFLCGQPHLDLTATYEATPPAEGPLPTGSRAEGEESTAETTPSPSPSTSPGLEERQR